MDMIKRTLLILSPFIPILAAPIYELIKYKRYKRKESIKRFGCPFKKYKFNDYILKKQILDNIELLEIYEKTYPDIIKNKNSETIRCFIQHLISEYNNSSKKIQKNTLFSANIYFNENNFIENEGFYVRSDRYGYSCLKLFPTKSVSLKRNLSVKVNEMEYRYINITKEIIEIFDGMKFIDFYFMFIKKE